MGDEREEPQVRRIRLVGERFKGGRLPIDSLIELQRYQDAIRAVAERDWRHDHPDEEPPPALVDSVSLTITRLDDGSADIFMAFEERAAYVEYQQVAQDAVNGTLEAAYRGSPLPSLPNDISEHVRAEAVEIGSTLEPGQSIEIYTGEPDGDPVVVTVESRKEAIGRLQLEGFLLDGMLTLAENVLQKVEETLLGRFTELDADGHKFRFESLRYGPLPGRYTDPSLTSDIRALLDSSAVAPVTRIVGDLQYRNGVPWRLREASAVEELDIDNQRWGASLIDIGSLDSGWGEAEDGKPITFAAIEAARDILRQVDEFEISGPGLFPTAAGGILMEWSSPEHVRSIEITPDGHFQLFDLPPDSFESRYEETGDLRKAIAFALGGERWK